MRQITMILMVCFLLTACGAKSEVEPVKPEQQTPSVEQPQETPTDTAPTTTPEPAPETPAEEPTEPTGELAQALEQYTISDQTVILDALNTALTLPEISGLTNSSLEANINSILAEGANEITSTLDGTTPVTITYEVKASSPTLLSIVYKAEIQIEDGTIIIWNPVNIDVLTATEVTFDSLYGTNESKTAQFKKAFASIAADFGYEFDQPEDWMEFYFTDNTAVFFFKDNDFSESYTEISLPLSELKPALNPMFSF